MWSLGQIGQILFFNSSYLLIKLTIKNTGCKILFYIIKASIWYQKLNIKHLKMDNLKFLIIHCSILEHITVLKQIHTLSTYRLFEHITVLKQTQTLIITYYQIHFFMCHTIFKTFQKTNWIIHKKITSFNNNEHMILLELLIISKLLIVTKAVFVT